MHIYPYSLKLFLKALAFFSFFFSILHAESYVTFDSFFFDNFDYKGNTLYRQRLGNQLLSFFEAYTQAKLHQATLAVPPMDVDLLPATAQRIKVVTFEEFFQIKKFTPLSSKSYPLDRDQDYLLIVQGDYLQKSVEKYKKNTHLKEELLQILEESLPHPPPYIQKTNLCIGVHIRTGKGFDHPLYSKPFYSYPINIKGTKTPASTQEPYLDIFRPIKAPPLQYYVDAISYFVKVIPQEIEFFLFTDYPDKGQLKALLQKHLPQKTKITLIEKTYVNHHEQDLSEILLMSSMDGIIRPGQSTFSIVSSIFSNYTYEMYPIEHEWKGRCLIMKKIIFQKNSKKNILQFY